MAEVLPPSGSGGGTKKRDGGVKGGNGSGSAKKFSPSSSTEKRQRTASKGHQPGRRKNAALYELLGAVSLYVFCVFAPGLLGAAVRFYEDTLGDVSGLHIVKSYRTATIIPTDPSPAVAPETRHRHRQRGHRDASRPRGGNEAGTGGVLAVEGDDVVPPADGTEEGRRRATAMRPRWRRSSSYLHWASSYLCGSSMLLSETGLCQSPDSSSLENDGEPPPEGSGEWERNGNSDGTPYSARDRIRSMLYGGGFWSDVELIAFLSLWLATVRVLLIHLLVPRYLHEPKRLAAMVRCKSSNFLSGPRYEFSPVRPVRSVRGVLRARNRGGLIGLGGGDDDGNGEFVIGDDLQQSLLMAPNLMEDDDDNALGAAGPVPPQPLRQPQASDGEPAAPPPAPPSPSSSSYVRAALRSTRSSFHRALGHEEIIDRDDDDDDVDCSATARMFSAPRRATAVFRFLYCSTSCLAAYGMFRSADFWPVHVGGRLQSSTRNCWDLSGGVALGWIDSTTGFELDRDFDDRNAALRLFFLAQGSYQLHSLCFHVMSMTLLFLYSGRGGSKKEGASGGRRGSLGGEGRLVSMKSSMKSYARPLLEHMVSLGLVFGAYIFSGLRRLGAVGIFTLDVSSAFLQLLQMCINAPEGSKLRDPKFLRFFHRFVVVPAFV